MGVCKEFFFIHPPAPEKSKYLSVGWHMRYLTLFCLLNAFLYVKGAVIFVDYESGQDSNLGTSTTLAWKHSPGDSQASLNASSYNLQAGDTVLFKGGVKYRGSIRVSKSGSPDKPIVFKGDGWGKGSAIIDGSEIVSTEWKVCTSAVQVNNNLNWKNIWIGKLPAIKSCYMANLQINDSLIHVAQNPSPTDPFYYDDVKNYLTPTSVTKTSLVDPRLKQLGGMDLISKYVYVYEGNNMVNDHAILTYDSTANKITFGTLEADPYTGSSARFALANYVGFIDSPGEYVYEQEKPVNGSVTTYLWPLRGNPNNDTITMSRRNNGFICKDVSNVAIIGFTIQNFSGEASTEDGNGIQVYNCNSVMIKGNIIQKNRYVHYGGYGGIFLTLSSQCVVDSNTCSSNPKQRGIFATACRDLVINKNIVIKAGSTGISNYGCTTSVVIGNKVLNSRGGHGNGMSFYNDNYNVLIAYNMVNNSNICLTMSASKNLTIYSNIFDGKEMTGYLMASWGQMSGLTSIINNTFVGSNTNYSLWVGVSEADSFVVINNILEGGAGDIQKRSNNLYTALSWDQDAAHTWKPLTGELIDKDKKGDYIGFNVNTVMANIQNDDYRLIIGSPAVRAAAKVTQNLPLSLFPNFNFYRDFGNNPRFKDSVWSIGAYENTPIATRNISFQIKTSHIEIVKTIKNLILIKSDMDNLNTFVISLFTLEGRTIPVTARVVDKKILKVSPMGKISRGCYLLAVKNSSRQRCIPLMMDK